MKLFKFIKDAGEKLFGSGEASAAPAAAPDANAKAAAAIKTYIEKLKLPIEALDVRFDGSTGTVSVGGTAPDQAARERVLLAAGNVSGVERVEDSIVVTKSEAEARFHTVERGDTLSAIAKQYYGDANKYPVIFEANKPMLSHPDKIYPGQMLRIPAE